MNLWLMIVGNSFLVFGPSVWHKTSRELSLMAKLQIYLKKSTLI